MAPRLVQSFVTGAKRPLHALRRVTRRNAPASVPQRFWERQGGEAWVARYWDDHGAPRRDMIVTAIRDAFGVPRSVLDVGCNAGPNLRRMHEEFPSCALAGFDVNAEAITYAKARFAEMRTAVDLRVGTFEDELARHRADSVDVVVSSFSLAYVPPRDLPRVLGYCVRIAERGLVLAEPLPFDAQRPEGVLSGTPDWRHDYRRVLAALGVTNVETFDAPEPGHEWSGLVVAVL
jgi:SAM-dependent methyltransferase